MPLTRSTKKFLQVGSEFGQHGMIRWFKNSRLYGCSVRDTWIQSPKKLPENVVELRWDGSKKPVFCFTHQVDLFDGEQVEWQEQQPQQIDYFLKMEFDRARKAVVQMKAQRRREIREMRRQSKGSRSPSHSSHCKSSSPTPSQNSIQSKLRPKRR
ncbi:unnamed protein product, partial [Mesorhabditis belari]|uniref:Uncharacterized protein n=1 Tax=Mesorhabditis belari TaxID=2138241 RepID=A0AAF3EP99_9BILA